MADTENDIAFRGAARPALDGAAAVGSVVGESPLFLQVAVTLDGACLERRAEIAAAEHVAVACWHGWTPLRWQFPSATWLGLPGRARTTACPMTRYAILATANELPLSALPVDRRNMAGSLLFSINESAIKALSSSCWRID
ncbi:MAG: hypothetical protein RLO48_07300 [Bauldia litoralis]